jgi:ribonuclease Y
METFYYLLTLGAGGALGYGVAYAIDRVRRMGIKRQNEDLIAAAQRQATDLQRDAELRAREIEQKAKDEVFKKREEFNAEIAQIRNELRDIERKLEKREELLDQQQQMVLKKERVADHTHKKLAERREALQKKQKELDEVLETQKQILHDLSGIGKKEAERMVLERVERELAIEIGSRLQKHEERIRIAAEEKARDIIATAVQRYASGHTAETTVSTVDIPNDDMKGRIIGREGRNIRTFEKCTGVDVIVDDTPGVVVVSAFDNVRRETARLALAKLIQDGRIHPSRIEEVVNETKAEMEKHILEVGKQAAMDANVPNLHDKLLQLLGRLRFRTSYSQNVLQHSLEVAHLAGLMAEELRLDGDLARRCGLLHDIGKAADHEMEGGHPKIGAELAKRYGENHPAVLHAILGHHDDVRVDHIYTVLVASADAISASRPGARRETLEKYVKRLEELEAVATGFPGVEQVYAIQAGREIRVIADAQRLSDADAQKLCRDIAHAIEEQLNYPGEIKVTVVRESRAVEFAR